MTQRVLGTAARPVFVVSLLAGLNLTASFANQLVLAYLFGASASMDAFLAAGALPLTVLGLAMGEVGYVLVPLLMRHEEKLADLQALVQRLFSLILLVAGGLTLIGLLAHRELLRLLTDAKMPATTFELAAGLAPWIWCLVGVSFVGSFLVGVHHFHRSFSTPALVSTLPYVGMTGSGLVLAPWLGIRSVALGWLAGATIKALALYLALPARGQLGLRWDLADPTVRRFCLAVVPMTISLLPFTLLPVIDVFWASRLPEGSISYLGYSTRIVIAVTTIAVQGISVVLFPDLSEDGVRGRLEEFRAKVANAVKSILLLVVPLAMVGASLRHSLVAIILERGSFTHAATNGVASVLPWYLLGMIGMAPMNIVSRAFYARADYRTPAMLGLLSLALYTALSGVLVKRYSYVGIGIAYALYWFFTFFLQCRVLGARLGVVLDREVLGFLVRVAACSLGAGWVVTQLGDWINGNFGLGLGTLAAGVCGLGLFGLLGHFVFRIPHFRMLAEVVWRRIA